MQTTLKNRIEKQINCRQHKKIVFDIFKNTPVIEHNNLCEYVEKCYKSYNENRNLMRKQNLVFEDFFKVYSHEEQKYILTPSISGLERFGDSIYKKIIDNNANKMINRTLSSKYRELLTENSRSLFVEMSLAGISVDTVRKEIGRKIAAIKTPKEFEEQAQRLLAHHSKWERSVVESRILKHNLVEGVDYDVFFDNGFNSISLRIHTFKASQAFGSIMWCITRTNAMFRSYRRDGSDYIFILNFSLPITDDLSLVAVLTDMHGRVDSIFNKKDIRLNHFTDKKILHNYFNPLALSEISQSHNMEEQNKKSTDIANFIECNNRSKINSETAFFDHAFNNPFFFEEKFGDKIDLNNDFHVSIIGAKIKKLDFTLYSDFIDQHHKHISYTKGKDFQLIENKTFLNQINSRSFHQSLSTYSYTDDFIVDKLENGDIDFLNSAAILIDSAITNGYSKLANYILKNKTQMKEEDRIDFCHKALYSLEKLEPNMDKKIGFDFINKIIPEKNHKNIFDNYFDFHFTNKTSLPFISTIQKSYNLKFEKIEFCESKFQFKNSIIPDELENISLYFELYDFSKPESTKMFLALILSRFLNVNDFLNKKTETKSNNEINLFFNMNFAFGMSDLFSSTKHKFLMGKFSMFSFCVIDKLLKEHPEHSQQIWKFIDKHDILFLTIRNALFLEHNFSKIKYSLEPIVNLLTKHNKIDKIKTKTLKKKLKKLQNNKVVNSSFYYFDKREPKDVLYKELIDYIEKF